MVDKPMISILCVLKANSVVSNTVFFWSDINSEFDGDDGRRVKYKIESISFAQKLLFQVKEGVYWGGHAGYKDVKYSPNNEAGEDFLFDNGIVDEETFGAGISRPQHATSYRVRN